MDVIPAVDLLGGKCVRLVQGRYDRVIDYESPPLECARVFERGGATWLHVIDLDGARNGCIENLAMLEALIGETQLRVQFGGGVRDEAAIEAALEAGAERIIIGTRALENWQWFERVVQNDAYRGRIALGLDARLGMLAVDGWRRETGRTATDVAEMVTGWPLAAIIYTDIGRDGLLLGPNINAIELLHAKSTMPVIASGGISELNDVRRLKAIGLSGVVIGRALYEKTLSLADALTIAAKPGA